LLKQVLAIKVYVEHYIPIYKQNGDQEAASTSLVDTFSRDLV
jgi:hypothetical protein